MADQVKPEVKTSPSTFLQKANEGKARVHAVMRLVLMYSMLLYSRSIEFSMSIVRIKEIPTENITCMV